ncbi:bacterioferritin [Mariniblastus fucicola]|uniref:Bacterioferritin n=1 Tax=Mariniblastus fucicola TaxID=980251 RepID=A0A5B9P7Q1_9BACT|nr:bacterioferritin [Mariniblastus fucicola]QEG22677.1 Bacterioferritin [Mariniblastus fucicola]
MTKTRSIENLQTALKMELGAVHQYQLHAGVLDDWGMELLASKMREEMREEIGHSDDYLSRILFLKGSPRLVLEQPPVQATTLNELFESDLKEEKAAIEFYSKAAREAADDGDLGTRVLFERIALDEEEHMGWLELQLDLIERMGEPAYISKHVPGPTA